MAEEMDRQIADLLSHLGKELGIDQLTVDEFGMCCLEIEAGVNVDIDFQPADDRVMFGSVVGRFSDATAADWYRQLMEANAFFVGTGGATLGVIRPENTVVLCFRHSLANLSGEHFLTLFNDFVEIGMQWRDRLLETPDAPADGTDPMAWMGQRA